MSVRTQHGNEPTLYYITYTCYNWLYLFSITNSYNLVYKWFNYLKNTAQIKVTAYVIMPNHVHVILFFPNENYNLNTIISNAKRFMAYEMVSCLKQLDENKILQQLEGGLSEREKKKGQLHKVFKDSFDAKPIYIKPFLLQKIQYIHLNPGRGKWKLVEDWREYKHSSASFYELNKVMHYQPLHYDELY
ncbi:MAG TPA: transposase [Chitinophagaceae bacterium]|nr:transposase [Chitinophagaceae bacterium]